MNKRIDKSDLFLISPAIRAQLTYDNIFLNWDNKDNLLSIEDDLYHASERRNISDLINKLIKDDFDNDEYQRIKKIKNINKIDNNNCKKRNESTKTLKLKHLKRKTYKKPFGKSG